MASRCTRTRRSKPVTARDVHTEQVPASSRLTGRSLTVRQPHTHQTHPVDRDYLMVTVLCAAAHTAGLPTTSIAGAQAPPGCPRTNLHTYIRHTSYTGRDRHHLRDETGAAAAVNERGFCVKAFLSLWPSPRSRFDARVFPRERCGAAACAHSRHTPTPDAVARAGDPAPAADAALLRTLQGLRLQGLA